MAGQLKSGLIRLDWYDSKYEPEVLYIGQDGYDGRLEWTSSELRCLLNHRNVIGMVALGNGMPIGFVVYSLHLHNLAIRHLAVDGMHRRRGVGSAMIDELKDKLVLGRRRRMTALVGEGMLDAQLFLRDSGFRAIKVLRGRWGDGDAYCMEYKS